MKTALSKEYLIKVETLKEGINELRGTIQNSYLEIDSLQKNIDMQLQVTKLNKKISIEGKIAFNLKLECARCLEKFTTNFIENIGAMFLPSKPSDVASNIEIEDSEINFYTRDAIDLLPVIRDIVLLSIPIKPICNPDCKGFCSMCGKNLNEENCNCNKNETRI